MLQKTPVNINFAKGLDTKTDPNQVNIGSFLTLTNSVFTTGGRLTKRNGFNILTQLPNTDQTTLTTFNNNLLATGSNLYAYNSELNQWFNKGTIQPITLSTLPIVRSSYSQIDADVAISSSGLACVTYQENGTSYYQIFDAQTGQQIVARVALPNTANLMRTFVLGQYFIVTYSTLISANAHLQYIAIPMGIPSSPLAAQNISIQVSVSSINYDGYVVNNTLFISYSNQTNTTINTVSLTSSLLLSAPYTLNTTNLPVYISVTADTTGAEAVIWTTYADSSVNNGFTYAVDPNLNPVLAQTQVITSTPINDITSVATNGLLTVIYEVANTYQSPYPVSNIKTNYLNKVTCTQSGTVGPTTTILRSVGLASKAFIGPSGKIYVLSAYGEANQPSYFLIDSIGDVYARLAYSNGGGYNINRTLSNVTLFNNQYVMAYLFKDSLVSVNKGTNLPSGTPVNTLYSNTGVNLAFFSINNSGQYSSEIASTLHLTGGQMWEYDGVKPVEEGFQVWPENTQVTGGSTTGNLTAQQYFYVFTYEWTDNQGLLQRSAPSIPITFTIDTPPATITGNRTSGSPIISGISSTSGLQSGQMVTGTGIPANTFISKVNSTTTITLNKNATSGSGTSTTLTVSATSALSLYVPTLRLTYKITPNPVRIVGYRWSVAQQTYYQFTDIENPTLNDPTVDYVTITDTLSDSQILGNTILYTTGGVVENIAPPANIASTMFKNRLMIVDAEDRNLIWYTKQIIEATPVEFSDLLTLYVAPTTGTQGSTGPITALSAMDDKLIIFKRDAIYYITGNGPDNTGANNDFTEAIFVTSSVGCSNPNSIVLTPNGLMFQSDKGIWLLGRDLSSNYIGAPVEGFNSNIVESAQVIPGTNQVRFTLDNNMMLMYDYFYNQWGTFTSQFAISATLYNNIHTYLNKYGYILQETQDKYIDGSSPVLMSFTTAWINLAGLQGFERFYFLYLLGTYFTPFKLAVQIAYNYNSSPTQSIMVTPDNASPNWGNEAQWGSGSNWGGGQGTGSSADSSANVFSVRIFPQQQKCESFQLFISEVYDPSLNVAAGEGLSLSGMNIVIGAKKGYKTQRSSTSFG